MLDLNLAKNILSIITIPSVAFIGLLLTIKFNFLQFRKLNLAFKYLLKNNKKDKSDNNKSISSFTALAAVLGGNLGTGNIAGIAVALTLGGPGALFWMWVMAFLGAIIKFSGCYLGVKYRAKTNFGALTGGPMYYIKKGLNNNFLSIMFCIFTILSSLSVGNLVQVNSVAVPINLIGISPLATGTLLSILIGIVIFGGLKFFSYIISRVVPIMACIYVLSGVFVLLLNYDMLIPSLIEILYLAFKGESGIIGGFSGYLIFNAISVGFNRGLFATDAGVGLAPILHSEVEAAEKDIDSALLQGLISTIAPIIVMLICMITGLVLMVTSAWTTEGLESTNICIKAFNDGLHTPYAGFIVLFTLFLFAFTTMMTWAHCGERAIQFMTKSKKIISMYRFLFIIIIPIGTFSSVNFVWAVADLSLNLMLLVNLFSVYLLRNEINIKFR